MNIITKIKNANLVGRGGGCFPTHLKWEMVKNAPGNVKYVVCNASEGEPGVKKDGYILENHGAEVIRGMEIAMDFLGASKGYIYLNHKYAKRFKKLLPKLIGERNIDVEVKAIEAGYVGGEETAVLQGIEKKKIKPRIRPPYPTTKGLFGKPTLINNVETFYNVSLVEKNEYKQERFYTLGGDCLNAGVYKYPENLTIEEVIKKTGNYPKFDFFVQVGGDASGEVLYSKQLKKPASGAGLITIYSLTKYKPKDMLRRWLNFFKDESCGHCTPCREGTNRLVEFMNSPKPDWQLISDLLVNLDKTAFCGLGCVVSNPIRSYIKNVLPLLPDKNIKPLADDKKMICECFN